MRRSYHVTHDNHTSSSWDTWGQAVANAVVDYKTLPDGVKVEITHMGAVVWGPYVVGSTRYRPVRL